MAIKYILHTGPVVDDEGNETWIDGDKLARLYGVPMSHCLIVNPGKEKEMAHLIPEDATHLHILKDEPYPQCF